ncbi:alcohol acetyltransferase [Penicillium malachiteum]|uniref:alcohol acetyltransferase n=1 Tax=Penicillium malachiteum TaxID=1324776 RepID=UPI00254667FF|nr:alcohol acetyltransferase [Penicillium malachiteum]KAJ5729663.1 alcohol acetyltransferase [Penicillium malachiteum]
MGDEKTFQILREASDNDKRTVVRHSLGFYRALILNGLYTLHDTDPFDVKDPSYFIPALKHCIAVHPILSAAVQDEHTETPRFIRPTSLNLQNHIELVDTALSAEPSSGDDIALITQITKGVHDKLFPQVDQIPPWKIVVVPLPNKPGEPGPQRVYIIFAYSHSHGDGKSGLSFHRTFLQGLKMGESRYDRNYMYLPPASPLLPPLEEACKLPISWSFLFQTFLKTALPDVVQRVLSFQSSGSPNIWTGEPTSYDPSNFRTGSEILIIKKAQLDSILKICREHKVRFTGVFNHLLVSVVDKILPKDTHARTFHGDIVVDLRSLIPAFAPNDMTNSVSALYETSTPSQRRSHMNSTDGLRYSDAFWESARETTARLAECANTLSDQPIGLMPYVGKFRPWLLEKLGKKRDMSYEISNLVVFDPKAGGLSETASNIEPRGWDIERMIFSQPADATGSALSFQLVSMKGGDMVITLNWQLGVLGVPDEEMFVKDILAGIDAALTRICSE